MKALFKDDDATSKTAFPNKKPKKTHFFQQPIKTLWILIAYKTHPLYIQGRKHGEIERIFSNAVRTLSYIMQVY